MDLNLVNPRELDLVHTVVAELVDGPLQADSLMLLGAECRNVLHCAHGHSFALRGTTDVDLAIVLPDWQMYEDVVSRFTPISHTGIRYRIAGISVDIMPFGGVEDPFGVVEPRRRRQTLSVFAFSEVFEKSLPLRLDTNLTIRIPSPAGYVALKMMAWVDRSAFHEYRDAPDIAAAVYWYSESSEMQDRLYETSEGQDILISANLDVITASACLLGRDVGRVVGPDRAGELRDAWLGTDLDTFGAKLGHDTLPTWPLDPGRRREIATWLTRGLMDGAADELPSR